MSVSNIPLLSSSADTGDDTRDMVANSKKVDFGWIGFWLLLSSQWHEQQENTRKSKQKLIFLLINLCVMIFIVVADILLIIVKTTNFDISLFFIMRHQVKSIDTLVSTCIESLIVTIMRMCVMYHFAKVEKTITSQRLSYYIKFQTSLLNGILEKIVPQTLGNEDVRRHISKISMRKYDIYPQIWYKVFWIYMVLYFVRKIIVVTIIVSNSNSYTDDNDDLWTVIFGFILYILGEMIVLSWSHAFPWIMLGFYICIFLIDSEIKLIQLIVHLSSFNCNVNNINGQDKNENEKEKEGISGQEQLELCKGNNDKCIDDEKNDHEAMPKQLQMMALSKINGKVKNVMMKKGDKMWFDKMNKVYDELYFEFYQEWESNHKIWQCVLLMSACAVIAVCWEAFTFFTGDNLVQFYFNMSFALVLALPFIMVLYFAIRLNTTFDVLKDLIGNQLQALNASKDCDYGYDYDHDINSLQFKQQWYKMQQWQQLINLKMKLEKFPVRCTMFGYPITLASVLSSLVIFGVSKIISVAIEYRYGY